jgi:hypothetical protein
MTPWELGPGGEGEAQRTASGPPPHRRPVDSADGDSADGDDDGEQLGELQDSPSADPAALRLSFPHAELQRKHNMTW